MSDSTTSPTLLALAEKIEAAVAADRALDIAIQRALAGDPKEHWYDYRGQWVTDEYWDFGGVRHYPDRLVVGPRGEPMIQRGRWEHD